MTYKPRPITSKACSPYKSDANLIQGAINMGKSKQFKDHSDDLEEKFESTLKAIPALRGASQIVELAIETLKMELPPVPPTVTEKKGAESKAKQQAVSAGRLEKISKRGSPTAEEDSVGRL